MTENRPPIDRLDLAIDRAVVDLTAHEAPADLRARVLACLEDPAPAGAWWSPGRMAAAAAAISVVAIAAYLAWPSRPAPVAPPDAVVAQAHRPASPPVTPAPEETTREAPAASGESVAGPGPAAPPARVAVAAAVVEPEPYAFIAPPSVEPLDAPPVVAIEPFVEPHLAIEPLAVDRLSFEQVVIEPLRLGR